MQFCTRNKTSEFVIFLSWTLGFDWDEGHQTSLKFINISKGRGVLTFRIFADVLQKPPRSVEGR